MLNSVASDYIKQLEGVAQNNNVAEKQLRLACHDLDITRRDIDSLRNDNQRMMQELQLLRQQMQQSQQPPQQSSAPPSQQNSIYGTPQHYVPPPPPPPPSAPMQDPGRSLPPLTNNGANSSSMQGIQYHER